MTTTRYAVVDVPTVGPHKGKITKVWDFDLHFSDAHVLKKRIANKRYSSCPTVLTEAEIKAHPRIGDAELRQPTPTEIADLKIDAKKFAGMTKEQEDKLVAELAGDLGAVLDPIVEAAKATTNLPPVTKHADGTLTVGSPPDGRSVKEHLDALATVGPSSSDLSFQVDAETLLRRRAHLQSSIDSLKAVKEPMERTEAGRAQMPKHWPYELKRMEDEIADIDRKLEPLMKAGIPVKDLGLAGAPAGGVPDDAFVDQIVGDAAMLGGLAGVEDLSDAKKAELDAIEKHVTSSVGPPPSYFGAAATAHAVDDAARVSIGTDGTKWWFWETEYPEDMVNGPFDDESACRAGVEDFYMKNNPFGPGQTPYEIEHVLSDGAFKRTFRIAALPDTAVVADPAVRHEP